MIKKISDLFQIIPRPTLNYLSFSSSRKCIHMNNFERQTSRIRTKYQEWLITLDHQSEDLLEQLDDLDLAEPVPNSPFLLKDVVDAIFCEAPFANTLELHPDHLRPVLYFAFRGDRQVIPQRIKRTFKRLNIKVNGTILQRIIQELVDAGLLPDTGDRRGDYR